MTRPTPEFLLATACCRWPSSLERDALIRARIAAIDWSRFTAVLRRHRVEGLAHHALLQAGVLVPPQFKAELDQDAVAIARQNLGFAAESFRLCRAMEAAELPFLFLKGATLDMLAYRTLGLKRARDIDIAVAPEGLGVACALLDDRGYQRIVPGPEIGPDKFTGWVHHCKETVWRHPATGIVVELHTGLVDNPDLLRGINVQSPRQLVEIGPGIRLPTLSDPELFAYLCVHGATHAWSRLKWLADLAAFLARFPVNQIEELYRAATSVGAGRGAAQALLLCADLLGTVLPNALAQELARDRGNRLLVTAGRAALQHETEFDDTVLGTVPIHLSHLLLGRGAPFKVAEIRRKLRSPHDRSTLNLTGPWRLLYPVLAIPRWLWRRAQGPAQP